MSLLKDIQKDAIDTNVDISVLLRKCQVLASRLGNKDFKAWVEHELNGYNSSYELPEYRIMKGMESHGDFLGIGWSQAKNMIIAPSSIPQEYRKITSIVYLIDAIKYYETLARESKASTVCEYWPADLVRYLNDKIINGMSCIRAWKVIPKFAIDSLLDTVRNRVLSFVLEIESEAPDAGEAPPNAKPITDERVGQVFNTYIQGNVASLNAGGQIVGQDIQITVVQNDLESLKNYLSSLGIGEPELKELDAAIQDDTHSGVKGKPGSKVTNWMTKMISKAGAGVWNIATTVAAELIAKALARYYGLPPTS